jgi:antirestriction protein ArdC
MPSKRKTKKISKPKSKKPRLDVCKEITDRMIALLEAGTVPWKRSWTCVGVPFNVKTGKQYRGMNIWSLMVAAMVKGYSDPRWLTYKQAQAMGGQVPTGTKGTHVMFWNFKEKEVEKDGELVKEKRVWARAYTVFNVEQVEGLKLDPIVPEAQPIEAAESMIAGYLSSGPTLKHGGNTAAYSSAADTVYMPAPGAFNAPENYYRTLFHELAHSTGHKSRLDRDLANVFGDHAYSEEELVAELAASMLSALCGISNDADEKNSAAYLAHWLEKLKANPKLLQSAASKAQKAVDHIMDAQEASMAA